MPESQATVDGIVQAASWDTRVALMRRIPEEFGTARQADIYSTVAKLAYVPNLAPDFAYVSWREDYSFPTVQAAYDEAYGRTHGFTDVGVERLTEVILQAPITLRIFRLLLGFLTQEFAATTLLVGTELGLPSAQNSRVKSIEAGKYLSPELARCCAEVIDRVMRGVLFPAVVGELNQKRKLDKPDTEDGWVTVRSLAQDGVPFPVFLHQRYYGGTFRQLLDATSQRRGDVLEDAVERLFAANGVQYLRTGAHSQREIERRFGLTVKPAPDFVVYDSRDTLRAMLECKGANDGGTARDKAARFRNLRTEATRLGGVPLFAVLSGLGWTRTADALGPVVRDTDGRTFTPVNLDEMLSTQPFPDLVAAAS